MELKSFAAALIVAFITVIIDAVFHFHYIYVLIIIVVLTYTLSRLLVTRTPMGDRTVSGSNVTGNILAKRYLRVLTMNLSGKEEREAVHQRVVTLMTEYPSQPQETSASPIPVIALLEGIASETRKKVDTEISFRGSVAGPEKLKKHLIDLLEIMDIRTMIETNTISLDEEQFCEMRISVNKKISAPENDSFATQMTILQHDVEMAGGLVWNHLAARKTFVTLLLPTA